MVREIKKLTPEWEAQIIPHRDMWRVKQTCCDPADFDRFEAGLARCYGFTGKPWHGRVFRVTNPSIPREAGPILDWMFQKGMTLTDNADPERLYDSVDAVLMAASGVIPERCEELTRYIQNEKEKHLQGAWGANWNAYTSYFRDVCGLELDGDLWERDQAYDDGNTPVGPHYSHTEFTLVSDRPLVQVWAELPKGYELHCTCGPSLLYRDGAEWFHIEGIKVTEQIVMEPHTMTVEQIQAEPNAELRRIMRQQYGEGKYLIETGAVVHDIGTETCDVGAAHRVVMKDSDGNYFLAGTDGSTGRLYYMPLDGPATCEEAHSQLCGFPDSLIRIKS